MGQEAKEPSQEGCCRTGQERRTWKVRLRVLLSGGLLFVVSFWAFFSAYRPPTYSIDFAYCRYREMLREVVDEKGNLVLVRPRDNIHLATRALEAFGYAQSGADSGSVLSRSAFLLNMHNLEMLTVAVVCGGDQAALEAESGVDSSTVADFGTWKLPKRDEVWHSMGEQVAASGNVWLFFGMVDFRHSALARFPMSPLTAGNVEEQSVARMNAFISSEDFASEAAEKQLSVNSFLNDICRVTGMTAEQLVCCLRARLTLHAPASNKPDATFGS